jgi:CxxC motif-containing protein (DUF1111 family)
MAADADAKLALGITGHPNRNGNDSTITRFGWKAQNKSLEIFAGEAYNVEMGVTNELFPADAPAPRMGCFPRAASSTRCRRTRRTLPRARRTRACRVT